MIANLDRLAVYSGNHGLKVRPHAKTHKSLEVARRQLERGAIGLTVAKLGEAEVFADVCNDILLAYPVVESARAERVAKLARHVDLKVAVDSEKAVNVLSYAAVAADAIVGILVDLDVGLHRTGVQSPQAALRLAQLVEESSGINLRGLFCYPGHIWDAADSQETALNAVSAQLEETLSDWQSHGLNAEIVSGGSTPTAYQSHLIEQLTEIRPGTYPFNDMNTVHGGFATFDDCAARIIVTVVSNAVPGQVVIDAGSKTFSADRCISQPESGYGFIVEYPEARLVKLSEEHGQINVAQCSKPPQLGERISIIPNHICPCINLQDRVWLSSPQGMKPLPIDARGKLT